MRMDGKTVNEGDVVYGSDQNRVGSVRYCEEDYCKVETGTGEECYVPSSAMEKTRPGELFLNVPSDRIGEMGWERPPERAGQGVRRNVVGSRETASEPRSAEEEIGESEPM